MIINIKHEKRKEHYIDVNPQLITPVNEKDF